MHDVSLRAASNRMDAHNLAIVLCPNLVASGNPMRDVLMCTVPGGPALFSPISRTTASPTAPVDGKTTLGTIVKTCIQRYFEIFDEVQDRSEAVPPPGVQTHDTPSNSSSASGSPEPSSRRFEMQDDDEEIDDAMLVMPIGPGGSGNNGSSSGNGHAQEPPASPPSAWGTTTHYKPRHRRVPSGGGSTSSGIRSMHTVGARTNSGSATGTVSKAKSLLSIEKGTGGDAGRRGSVTIGRGGTGTARKAAGAGVTAISVTASGFFTPPSSAPPVPPIPKRAGVREGNGGTS